VKIRHKTSYLFELTRAVCKQWHLFKQHVSLRFAERHSLVALLKFLLLGLFCDNWPETKNLSEFHGGVLGMSND